MAKFAEKIAASGKNRGRELARIINQRQFLQPADNH
jgi:hypothetical protein